MQGPPSVPQVKLSLGQLQAGAKCQTTQVPAARGHQARGERGFSQQEVREKESNREVFKTFLKEEEERIAVCSKLFTAVHRKREGMGGDKGPAAQQSWGGQGSGVRARLFALHSLSLLCSQPAWEEVGNACPQPQGPGLPSPTGLWVLRDLSQGFCHRETIQCCHLEVYFVKFPSVLNSSTSAFWQCY